MTITLLTQYCLLEIVENDDFRNMLTTHAPQFVPMSHKRVDTLISKKYHEVQVVMNALLKDTIGGVTTDGWTSAGGHILSVK